MRDKEELKACSSSDLLVIYMYHLGERDKWYYSNEKSPNPFSKRWLKIHNEFLVILEKYDVWGDRAVVKGDD